MTLANLFSRTLVGVSTAEVSIEVHLANGLPKFLMVGLAEMAVKESKDRVRSAIINSQYKFPARRITVNLAPADLPKDGCRFDLPIALGILLANQQLLANNIDDYEFIGELALSGELRAVKGVLPIAIAAQKAGRKLILPEANAKEANLIADLEVLPAKHLLDVCAHLCDRQALVSHQEKLTIATPETDLDLQDVYGQAQGRRALEIAAAGGHSLLMCGPPGTGKTMLASRLPSILPQMSDSEALDVAAIASITGAGFNTRDWKQRPFRNPHHTASNVALVGGGSLPSPGEITRAHNGVLFLDELPEFKRHVLEALREPLESGRITISRAARQIDFPAKFQLIAAMNPCPCGYLSDPKADCYCTEEQVRRYRQRLSGPLLDRIDMHVEIASLANKLFIEEKKQKNESSKTIQLRVNKARQRQLKRCNKVNADLNNQELENYATLTSSQTAWLVEALETLNLSARSYHRLLRIARTIADLGECDEIGKTHLAEALSYRMRS